MKRIRLWFGQLAQRQRASCNLSLPMIWLPITRPRLWVALALLALVMALPARGQAPGLLWVTNVGATVFAVDAQTNLYATAGSNVITLNSAGVPLQTNSICPLPGIAQRDAAGNFYFAGSFDGTNDFGGITLVGGWTNWPSPGHWTPGWPTCFLAKYAANGALQWVVSFGAQGCVNTIADLALNCDGSVVVSYGNPNDGAVLSQFSGTGTNLWGKSLLSGPVPPMVKVCGIAGTNGCFIGFRFDSPFCPVGFYDFAGNVTFGTGTGFPPCWISQLSKNAKPVVGTANDAYVAALSYGDMKPYLWKYLDGGGVAWTQSVGTVEQWVLAGESAGDLFLAGTNGIFSKYYNDGTLVWSTNYGSPAVGMVIDSVGNRFVNFSNGSVAQIAGEVLPQAPTISNGPQSQTVFVGSNVTFSVSADGTQPLRYFWLHDTNPISGANSATLSLTNTTTAQAGYYCAIVSNFVGSVTSPPALLRVKRVQLYLGSQMLTNGTYTFATNPTFSVCSAFTNGSAFYTLDGSPPSFASTYYSGPFTLTNNATVRAIGYSADFLQSEEADPVIAIVPPEHTLTATAAGGGNVNLNPAGGIYTETTVVTATAVPASGWSFLYWMGDASGLNPVTSVTMERDKAIQAVFGTSLGTTVAGNGQVQVFPGGLHPYGSVVRLTAVPDPGNYFGFWGNAATGNTNPLYFTVTSANPTVSSIFASVLADQAALTVLINGYGRVTVSPRANLYSTNQSVTLTAVPDSGQQFVNWSGDATGTSNPLGVSMAQSKFITANFTKWPALAADQSGCSAQGFAFKISGSPPMTYQVFASTNLSAWQSLAIVTNTSGELQFTDCAATNLTLRFYKALPWPE